MKKIFLIVCWYSLTALAQLSPITVSYQKSQKAHRNGIISVESFQSCGPGPLCLEIVLQRLPCGSQIETDRITRKIITLDESKRLAEARVIQDTMSLRLAIKTAQEKLAFLQNFATSSTAKPIISALWTIQKSKIVSEVIARS